MRRSASTPHLHWPTTNRGDARFGKGDAGGAMVDFNTAIKLDPMLAIAYGNRGFAYYRKRDTMHAIEDYSTQIKLSPGILAYLNRGNAYRDSEQLELAAADYAEVIQAGAGGCTGLAHRGMIRLYKGDNRGGLDDYITRCNTIPPTHSPGTIARRPSCGLATRRARSRIFAKRWSFARFADRADGLQQLGVAP